ncbi:restriction endonuclease subunit S [Flavobacterium sp.]|uniref:restriction endonuclease subunit S n=1 Tax=Flavobacterium sp. TaxID=239 RepID=UPI00262CEF95|nr:restriction endonuclease subunit S [Flavobacterium sp.]
METLQPKLRFPEFNGEYKIISLKEITTKIGDGLHSTPKYDENGDYYFINGNNLVDGTIKFFETTKKVGEIEFKKNKKPLSNKTILLSINGTIGSLANYNNENIILGKSACYINVNNENDKSYVYYILQSNKVINHFNSELTGTTIKNLSLGTINKLNIEIPSLQEQTKIANFLSAVDTKLNQLTKKKNLLEQYKRGIMQKIFTQEIRFKDDNGNDFADWEEKLIGQILNIGSGKDYKHLQSGDIPVYGTGGLMCYVDNYLYDGETVCIGRKGTIDKPMYFNEKIWTVDTLFYTYNFINAIPKFVYYTFQTINWRLYSEASGVPSLSKNTIEKIEICIPQIEEQTKIANFLSAIDEKINHIGKQLEQTNQYKKGLLQQLFV